MISHIFSAIIFTLQLSLYALKIVVQLAAQSHFSLGMIPGTHWVEGWAGHRACPDVVAKRKNPVLLGIEP